MAAQQDSHFRAIVQAEVDVINRRRAWLNRERLPEVTVGPVAPVLDVTALALSGGGIRSASFALGVLQALDKTGCLARIDYLSTVSGGGYIGSALSATLTVSKAKFELGTDADEGARFKDIYTRDSEPVGHIRNYSNYLVPFGLRDLLTAIAIIVRGLVANISLVLPVILLFAGLTIFSNPNRGDLLRADVFGYELTWLTLTHFGVTLLLALLAFPIFFVWAIYRSLASKDKQSEFRTWIPSLAAGYLVLVAATFFVELQPYLIEGMFELAEELSTKNHSLLVAFVKHLTVIAAPIAAIVTVFRQQVGTLLKSVTMTSGKATKLAAYGARAGLWIGGAAVPLLIWVAYLYLSYWGIINKGAPASMSSAAPRAEIRGMMKAQLLGSCRDRETRKEENPEDPNFDPGAHTPSWLLSAANRGYAILSSVVSPNCMPERFANRPVTVLYFGGGLLLFLLSYLLMPNANSLHRLYRDRLSKAFLFDPNKRATAKADGSADGVDLGRDFEQLDTMRISDLIPKEKDANGQQLPPYAPYHLINAALNIQGSDYANRRGRNADFFLFSPLYVGSEATGYIGTIEHERKTALDLPTAMAISGAAFSSNMGANSIRALTPTLALLNIRTGYWLCNPLAFPGVIGPEKRKVKKRFGSKAYLWSEISGRLYEDSPDVYITDGGHIENLGVYQLLRRRCKFIIVVDAEADPAMRMPSFIALQRYARIDLGVRIRMPWDGICRSTKSWMGYDVSAAESDDDKIGKKLVAGFGPHAAVGTIYYEGGARGWLLYIKASLSGDENDYVRDYARRYDQFPHESTGDQFFSEEQFEVYRALGYHIAARLLNGDDKLQVDGIDQPVAIDSTNANVRPMREALFGAEVVPAGSVVHG